MRKLFVVPLLVLAFVAGVFYGDQTNDMLDNLAVLCRSCHMKRHRGEQ